MTATTPQVGATAPALEKYVDSPDLVAYAGATWDWHRIHYDMDYVAAKQLPAPIVDGQVYGAWFVQLIQDWLGPGCFVRTLDFSFRNLMFVRETLRLEGVVTAVQGDEVTLELSATILAVDGAEDRPAVSTASATVLVGRADGPQS